MTLYGSYKKNDKWGMQFVVDSYEVEKPYMEKAFFANKDIQFKLAMLGNDAGICGAAKLVL